MIIIFFIYFQSYFFNLFSFLVPLITMIVFDLDIPEEIFLIRSHIEQKQQDFSVISDNFGLKTSVKQVNSLVSELN